MIFCAAAYGLKVELGGTVVSATATIVPRELPTRGGAPVEVGSVVRIKTTDGSQPSPLQQIVFMFDKHGSVDTKGLPVCREAQIADATPQQARQRCSGAIVGKGVGKAEVVLPGRSPIEISSPLTFFNAPAVDGRPSLIAHAYERVPEPRAVLVPFSIERVSHGRYGFRAKIELPEIAGGFGAATLAEATVGKTWKRGGGRVGYLNAFCNGGRLQVHGTISLEDGSFFPGTLTSPCHAPG